MRLPARLGDRLIGEGQCLQVDRFLQPQTPPLRSWRQITGRGLLAEKRQIPTRSAGAESSLNYARTCPRDRE